MDFSANEKFLTLISGSAGKRILIDEDHRIHIELYKRWNRDVNRAILSTCKTNIKTLCILYDYVIDKYDFYHDDANKVLFSKIFSSLPIEDMGRFKIPQVR